MPAINFRVQGQGIPVILIHGFCENLTMWNNIAAPLSEHYQIYSIDLPGFGKSELPTNNISLELVAEILKDWAIAQGIDEAVWIGHSLGGYVGLALADLFPETIKGFGLIHSTAFADTIEGKENRNRVMEFILKHGHQKWIETFAPSLFARDNLNHCQEAVEAIRQMGLNTSQESILAYTKAMRDRPDRFNVWKNIMAHCLFVGGTEDIRIGPEISEEHIYGRETVDGYILQGIGHMGMFEDRNQFQVILENYLGKIS
ncbi:alpha/beta fold hydrolase [Roseivirga sp.]|uniref:alpha/beta fold hydrolase n=1 Tax=Roseivirga sp. TaxID=1964215 RepID=UPI003B5300E5